MFDIFFKKFVIFEIMLFFCMFLLFLNNKTRILLFLKNHVSGNCVLRPAISCHWVLALYLQSWPSASFFYNGTCFWCLCTSPGHLLSLHSRFFFTTKNIDILLHYSNIAIFLLYFSKIAICLKIYSKMQTFQIF